MDHSIGSFYYMKSIKYSIKSSFWFTSEWVPIFRRNLHISLKRFTILWSFFKKTLGCTIETISIMATIFLWHDIIIMKQLDWWKLLEWSCFFICKIDIQGRTQTSTLTTGKEGLKIVSLIAFCLITQKQLRGSHRSNCGDHTEATAAITQKQLRKSHRRYCGDHTEATTVITQMLLRGSHRRYCGDQTDATTGITQTLLRGSHRCYYVDHTDATTGITQTILRGSHRRYCGYHTDATAGITLTLLRGSHRRYWVEQIAILVKNIFLLYVHIKSVTRGGGGYFDIKFCIVMPKS